MDAQSVCSHSLIAAVGLALLCTALALLLYFRLVRTIGSIGVASNSYLRAAVSVVLGVFVLGERLTPGVAMGLAAVIAGVALINLPPPGNGRRRENRSARMRRG